MVLGKTMKELFDLMYTIGTYAHLYGKYDKRTPPTGHYFKCGEYLKNCLLVPEQTKILEVGCGTGAFLSCLQRVGFTDILGVDVSSVALELSIMPECSVQGDASALTFPDNSFDLLVSIGTYEHVFKERCEAALLEIGRVAKRAVLWIDHADDDGDITHAFNEDEIWWADKITQLTGLKTRIDFTMKGGSNTHPILVNFDKLVF